MTVEQLPKKPAAKKPASGLYMVFLLGIVSAGCGLVIVLAYAATASAIERNLAQITREAVSAILPEADRQVIYAVEPTGELTEASGSEGPLPKLYAGYDGAGHLVGVVCEASGRGYADIIRALYAYSPEKECITGFKVLDLKETPGLGDKIARDRDFLANFESLDARLAPSAEGLAHPIEAVKHGAKSEDWQIDGISGATISSKAVARLLNESVTRMAPVIMRHAEQLERGK